MPEPGEFGVPQGVIYDPRSDSSYDPDDPLAVRINGFFETLAGLGEAVSGFTFGTVTAETGLGAAVGYGIGIHGCDVASTGFGKLMDR